MRCGHLCTEGDDEARTDRAALSPTLSLTSTDVIRLPARTIPRPLTPTDRRDLKFLAILDLSRAGWKPPKIAAAVGLSVRAVQLRLQQAETIRREFTFGAD